VLEAPVVIPVVVYACSAVGVVVTAIIVAGGLAGSVKASPITKNIINSIIGNPILRHLDITITYTSMFSPYLNWLGIATESGIIIRTSIIIGTVPSSVDVLVATRRHAAINVENSKAIVALLFMPMIIYIVGYITVGGLRSINAPQKS
jgi:hypothetical protein